MSTEEQKNSSLITQLFKAGAHFGFTKSRRHPTITPYIFANKLGTDIFDLEQTSQLLEDAKQMLKEAGEQGRTILYVGTKDEASKVVLQYATKAEMPVVVNRWIGGMLTNFSEIRKRIERLKQLTAERESGELERKYIKKERVVIGREVDKLEFNFGGIKDMDRMPFAMLVVDPRHDSIAVQEAIDMKIPVIAIMSSDCDISKVTKPVVVNDALLASVEFALSELTAAYVEGRKNYTPAPARPAISRSSNVRSDTRPRTPRTTPDRQ
jgi:small subunit ribosomal protein S2